MFTVCLIAAVVSAEPVRLDRPQPAYLYSDKFREVLRQPLIASWDNVEPRALFRRLSEDRQVGFVIDRRVDPSTPLTLSLTGESLLSGAEKIAAAMDAAVCLPGNVVYVGPAETTRWLRTAIEQHELALRDPERSIPMRRVLDLSARHTIHWQDLDTPREILAQIAKRHRLNIENLDAVPHDLWASATLPQATAAEALTIVLTQFDLGWDWVAGGQAIRIGPWQEPPVIERRYKPRGRLSAAQLLADWQGSDPELKARVERAEVVVLARVEEHEALQAKLSAGITGQSLPADEAPTPLRRRLFTLRIENAPVSAIMRELEKSGVVFEYDAAALRAAGVNLDRPVNMDVLKATADEFLQKLFGEMAVTFEIDNLTVRLKPKT